MLHHIHMWCDIVIRLLSLDMTWHDIGIPYNYDNLMPSCVGRSSDNLARALTEWLLYTVQVERTPIEDTPMLFSITREELGVNSTSPVFISPATNDHGLKAFRESRLRFEKYATKSLGCQDSNLKKKIWYNIFNMTGIWMEWNRIDSTLRLYSQSLSLKSSLKFSRFS